MTGHVFVDASGRRARLVAAACWALALVFAGYVVLVAVALVTPPGTLSLSVPGLGPVLPKTAAPALETSGGPQAKLLSALPTPSAAPPAGRTPAVLTTAAPGRARPSPVPSPRPPAAPTSAAAATPTPTPHATGRPTSAPTGPPSRQPTPTPTRGQGNGRPTAHPTANPHASKSPTR